MSTGVPALFAAGHGFYQFAITRDAFDRSLYYNLLLQPALAIPDHYLLQGEWVGRHLDGHRSRDSWLEEGLKNGFVVPYFRREASSLSDLLSYMEGADRRGFSDRAGQIAARLDRATLRPQLWSSADNSSNFGKVAAHYLGATEPPMLELALDPDDFAGFWSRSRSWVDRELDTAADRSSALLGSDGLLLSQLIQVTGERLLGASCGRIGSVDDLLSRVRREVGETAERDVRVYYTSLCELYNRSLADTILTAPNSPRWDTYAAALDLWREDLVAPGPGPGAAPSGPSEPIDVTIRLPRPHHLRAVSGDVLVSLRKSAICERYFESLEHWRQAPADEVVQSELVESLARYAREITDRVGKEVGAFGLHPQFISKASDVGRALERVPGVVQGFLAVGSAAGTAAVAATGTSPDLVPAGLLTLFCLYAGAKYYAPANDVGVSLETTRGVRFHADITVSRA